MNTINQLSEEIGELLNREGQSLAVAESCTGGLISAALTEIPGSSKYFGYGVVAYSNEAKVKLLRVSPNTLKKYGAVSSQTAVEMAEGIRLLSGSDYGLSVTGIAGPGGATKTKPVGLVYIGFSSSKGCLWKELRLKGTRQEIRSATVKTALTWAAGNISEQA